MRLRPKGTAVTESKVRVNQKIRSSKVRVISPDGEQLGILDLSEALHRSEEFGLDLVEVAPNVEPPVCKIMDYGKFRYEESKKDHERKKKQAVVIVKEIKLRPKTGEHDLEVKARQIKSFLEDDFKVKITVMFRGREITHPEQARNLLDKLLQVVGEDSQVEQPSKFEGRNMTMVIGPK